MRNTMSSWLLGNSPDNGTYILYTTKVNNRADLPHKQSAHMQNISVTCVYIAGGFGCGVNVFGDQVGVVSVVQ